MWHHKSLVVVVCAFSVCTTLEIVSAQPQDFRCERARGRVACNTAVWKRSHLQLFVHQDTVFTSRGTTCTLLLSHPINSGLSRFILVLANAFSPPCKSCHPFLQHYVSVTPVLLSTTPLRKNFLLIGNTKALASKLRYDHFHIPV